MAAKQDINDFNARVARINNPGNKSYYDQDLGMHIPKHVSGAKLKKPKAANDEALFGPFLVSAIIGAFCLALAQLVRIRYFGLIEDGGVALAIDLLSALWFLLLLTALIKRKGVGARFSQFVGVAAMMMAGHNLFWRWPEPMATIYTPEYAQYVERTTTPPSIVVGSTIYAF